jgi:hypothetical protein
LEELELLLESFCEFDPTVTPFVGTELLDVFVSPPLFNVTSELPLLVTLPDSLVLDPLDPLVLDPGVLFEVVEPFDPFEFELDPDVLSGVFVPFAFPEFVPFAFPEFVPFELDLLDLSFFLDADFALSIADIVFSEPPAPILACRSLKADKLFNILIVLIAEFRPISIPVEIPIIDPHGLLLPYVL